MGVLFGFSLAFNVQVYVQRSTLASGVGVSVQRLRWRFRLGLGLGLGLSLQQDEIKKVRAIYKELYVQEPLGDNIETLTEVH